MQVSFNNKKINYEDSGKGHVLVLLHGFTETLNMWNEFSKKLSAQFRVVCIDLPGHGKSECVDDVHSMELMADAVKTVLDKLNINKAVVVGHSMGGYVALSFARKYEHVLKGLGLFHSSANSDSEQAKEGRMRAVEVIKKNHVDFLLNFIPDLFAPENRDVFKKEIEVLLTEARKIPVEGIIAALMGMKDRPDSNDILENAEYPVMFIAGHKDTRIPVKDVLAQLALPKTAYSLLLKKTGHMGYIEERSTTLNFLETFVKGCFSRNKD